MMEEPIQQIPTTAAAPTPPASLQPQNQDYSQILQTPMSVLIQRWNEWNGRS